MDYINRKQLAVILEIHPNTATKKYPEYLNKAGKDLDQRLTLEDVSRIEKRRVKDIKDKLF